MILWCRTFLSLLLNQIMQSIEVRTKGTITAVRSQRDLNQNSWQLLTSLRTVFLRVPKFGFFKRFSSSVSNVFRSKRIPSVFGKLFAQLILRNRFLSLLIWIGLIKGLPSADLRNQSPVVLSGVINLIDFVPFEYCSSHPHKRPNHDSEARLRFVILTWSVSYFK